MLAGLLGCGRLLVNVGLVARVHVRDEWTHSVGANNDSCKRLDCKALAVLGVTRRRTDLSGWSVPPGNTCETI